MRMLEWSPEVIRFLRDATEQSDFYKRLADRLMPYLAPTDFVCDAGCGLGGLALALAARVERVTAIDRNGDALAVLRDWCLERRVNNVRLWQGEMARYNGPQPFQAMVFCRFGRVEEILTLSRRLCRGKVLLVKREGTRHRFSPGRQRLENPGGPTAKERLAELHIPCVKESFELAFPQPFRCWADVGRFFEIYNRDPTLRSIPEEWLRQRVRETGDPAFPYLLPSKQRYGLLCFQARAIPASLGGTGESR